ncbi:hypothetical protein [Nocardioides convexus]|uniref:hypothetical protein n=1 Tax=Nocardioides convexus TaxID=2712224 RepID=UPI002418716D|nr:hypothetical protein [Nocardioides convexus]
MDDRRLRAVPRAARPPQPRPRRRAGPGRGARRPGCRRRRGALGRCAGGHEGRRPHDRAGHPHRRPLPQDARPAAPARAARAAGAGRAVVRPGAGGGQQPARDHGVPRRARGLLPARRRRGRDRPRRPADRGRPGHRVQQTPTTPSTVRAASPTAVVRCWPSPTPPTWCSSAPARR